MILTTMISYLIILILVDIKYIIPLYKLCLAEVISLISYKNRWFNWRCIWSYNRIRSGCFVLIFGGDDMDIIMIRHGKAKII